MSCGAILAAAVDFLHLSMKTVMCLCTAGNGDGLTCHFDMKRVRMRSTGTAQSLLYWLQVLICLLILIQISVSLSLQCCLCWQTHRLSFLLVRWVYDAVFYVDHFTQQKGFVFTREEKTVYLFIFLMYLFLFRLFF